MRSICICRKQLEKFGTESVSKILSVEFGSYTLIFATFSELASELLGVAYVIFDRVMVLCQFWRFPTFQPLTEKANFLACCYRYLISGSKVIKLFSCSTQLSMEF